MCWWNPSPNPLPDTVACAWWWSRRRKEEEEDGADTIIPTMQTGPLRLQEKME